MENRYFPLFVPAEGRKFVVFGGGTIAERRVKTLLEFGFAITVISPKVSNNLKALADSGKITYIEDVYKEQYLDGAEFSTACTNDRQINRKIGEAARARGIWVSVCDRREECSFYFPAIAVNEDVTMGLVGSGKSHGATRKAAAILREIIKGKAYE